MVSNLLSQLSGIARFGDADADAPAYRMMRVEDGAGEKNRPDNRLFIVDGVPLPPDLLPLQFDLGFSGQRPGRLLFRLEILEERGLARRWKKSRQRLTGSRRMEMNFSPQWPHEAEIATRLLNIHKDASVTPQHCQIGALVKSFHRLAQIRLRHLNQSAPAIQPARQCYHLHTQPIRPADAFLLDVPVPLETVENPVR